MARLLLCVLMALVSLAVVEGRDCTNTLSDFILNRCLLNDNVVAQGFANTVNSWVNPRVTAVCALVFILVLPFVWFRGARTVCARTLNSFLSVRLQALNFLHRMCYTAVLGVGLYTVFRQHRPCQCRDSIDKPYTQLWSVYGMPSGDAMCGAIVGAFLFEKTFRNRAWGAVAAAVVMICKMSERLILGYHTLGQVITGSVIGLTLHVYSTRVPQYMVFVDTVLSIILLIGGIGLDGEARERMWTAGGNDLFSWGLWGMGIQLFTCMMLARHYYSFEAGSPTLAENLRHSLEHHTRAYNAAETSDEEQQELQPKTSSYLPLSDQAHVSVFQASDYVFTLVAFGLCVVTNILSAAAATEMWF
eukprot:gnl/Hemi2/13774_TR4685_c0_g1_i1.p1 gnl/Hemi2/13774_TR4685_c0_g1~~gnl/Hemi2/13774_TR4685_c0_g1_i1.p1  ORF type:complete len:360 (-),score=104.69 gnl/Hemi2/13774_TR4685_c0_g1_i1:118-1197(-)